MKTYIVLDLEWNQSPQGKEGSVEGIPFEIIEIGAVKLDENLREIERFHALICPAVYHKMHAKIHELIQRDIKIYQREGRDFPTVIEEFKEFAFPAGEHPFFCSWGSMDLTELQRNLNFYELENFFSYPLYYYDVQKLYSLSQLEDPRERLPLEKAVKQLEIEAKASFHDALEDALYAAKVLGKLDFDRVQVYKSLDLYRSPRSREDEIYIIFPDYAKYVSRAFESREKLIEDKRVKDMLCCKCRRMLRKKIRWFADTQKNYYCIAVCPEHGYVRGKIKVRHNAEENYYCVKSMRLVEESAVQEIRHKKEQMSLKRKRS